MADLITAKVDFRRIKVVQEANKKVRTLIATTLRKQGRELVKLIRSEIRRHYKRRSGKLISSVEVQDIDTARHQWSISVSVGKGLPYAHTLLNTIGHKTLINTRGQILAIPQDGAARRMSASGSLWQYSSLKRIGNFKNGSAMLGVPSGRSADGVALVSPRFHLVKKAVFVEAQVNPVTLAEMQGRLFKMELKEKIAEKFA